MANHREIELSCPDIPTTDKTIIVGCKKIVSLEADARRNVALNSLQVASRVSIVLIRPRLTEFRLVRVVLWFISHVSKPHHFVIIWSFKQDCF